MLVIPERDHPLQHLLRDSMGSAQEVPAVAHGHVENECADETMALIVAAIAAFAVQVAAVVG